MVNKLYHRLHTRSPSDKRWNSSRSYLNDRVCFDHRRICSYLQSRQISSESDIQPKSASKCPNKGGTPTKKVRLQCYICLSCFSSLLSSSFAFNNTVHDKYFWNFSINITIAGVAWRLCRARRTSGKARKTRNPRAERAWTSVEATPISSRFLCPSPPLLLCAPNQNHHCM